MLVTIGCNGHLAPVHGDSRKKSTLASGPLSGIVRSPNVDDGRCQLCAFFSGRLFSGHERNRPGISQCRDLPRTHSISTNIDIEAPADLRNAPVVKSVQSFGLVLSRCVLLWTLRASIVLVRSHPLESHCFLSG